MTEPKVERVTTRDDRFQRWEVLLRNRAKRTRRGELLVHGVRPIDQAVAAGWRVTALLHAGGTRSGWAAGLLAAGVAERLVELPPALLAELGDKDDDTPPELIAVVAMAPDRLDRIQPGPDGLVVVLDRPGNPGNLGTVIRSCDALGAAGVVITGHAADLYDPRTVRASRGSLFAVPVVRVESPAVAADWAGERGLTLLGTSEDGARPIWEHDLTRPTALVAGNETRGMSAFWTGACDAVAAIPMAGAASSLNAAVATSITLYEAARQRSVR
jgi:tRNA G18 (ribose-2'-O)-methylase SpoU